MAKKNLPHPPRKIGDEKQDELLRHLWSLTFLKGDCPAGTSYGDIATSLARLSIWYAACEMGVDEKNLTDEQWSQLREAYVKYGNAVSDVLES